MLIDKIFEGVVLVGHDRGHKSGGNLGNRSVVGIQESVLEGHDIVTNKATFGNDEEGHLWGSPAIPVEEQVTLDPVYPPNIVGSNRPVLGVGGTCDVGYNEEEVGGMDGITEHITEENDLGCIDGAVVGWRESNNTWALLFLPELESDGVKMGADGLTGVTFDVRETVFGPWN